MALHSLGVRNLRVPLDVGEPRLSADKAGEEATEIDVIFNGAVVRRAQEGHQAQYWQSELANLALHWVAQEMKTEVSTRRPLESYRRT